MAESNTKKNSTQKLPLSVFYTVGGSFIGVFRILRMGYRTERTPRAVVWADRATPYLYSDRKRGIRAGCFCRLVRVSVSVGFWDDFCHRAACPCLHCRRVRSGAEHPCRSGGRGRIGWAGRHAGASPPAVPSYPPSTALLSVGGDRNRHTDYQKVLIIRII